MTDFANVPKWLDLLSLEWSGFGVMLFSFKRLSGLAGVSFLKGVSFSFNAGSFLEIPD